eukprot:ANDGO_07880.mRNA.1 Vacuolar protein sorting-associated protein 51 homolog
MSETEDGDDGGRQRRRARDLLGMYYGVGETPTRRAAHDLDIDSAQFVADRYLKDVLAKKAVNGLIEESNTRINEMKSLDSDLQMLVYENYNKFISATDTIKTMKTNVENMESELKQLDENMKAIDSCSKTIHSKIGERRTKIESMNSAFTQLKRLQFLLELPGRLKKCIEMKAYAQAVSYWEAASKILTQYSHLESFSRIIKECKAPLEELKTRLRSAVTLIPVSEKVTKEAKQEQHQLLQQSEKKKKRKDESVDKDSGASKNAEIDEDLPSNRLSEMAEYVQMLHKLGDNVNAVRDMFLLHRKQLLTKALQNWAPLNPTESVMTCVARLNARFMPRLAWTCRVFIPLFSDIDDRKELVQWARDVGGQYLSAMRELLTSADWSFERLSNNAQSPTEFNDALSVIGEEVRRIAAYVPESHLEETLANTISNIVRGRVRKEFDLIAAKFRAFMDKEISSSTTPESASLFDVPDVSFVRDDLQNVVLFVDPLIFGNESLRPGHKKSLVQVVSTILVDFVPSNVDAFMSVFLKSRAGLPEVVFSAVSTKASPSSAGNASAISALGSLRLCQLCLGVARHVVPVITKVLKPYVAAMDDSEGFSSFSAEKLTEQVLRLARTFVTQYAESTSRSISNTFSASMDAVNWLQAKEPKDVREITVSVVKELSAANQRLKCSFPSAIIPQGVKNLHPELTSEDRGIDRHGSMSTGLHASSTTSNISPSSSSHGISSSGSFNGGLSSASSRGRRSGTVTHHPSTGVGMEVDKVFSKGLAQFSVTPPLFTPASVMMFILKRVFKSISEAIRLQTLSVNGRTQLLVDLEYMRLRMMPLVADADRADVSKLETLVDVALQICKDRCVSTEKPPADLVRQLATTRASRE